MNLKNLFLIAAIVSVVFGALFVLLPEQTLAQYGISMMTKAHILIGRLFGAALLSVGIVAWFARFMGAEAQDGIMLAIIVGNGVGFIVTLLAQLDGVVNNLGWSTVAIYLLLGLGFVYFKYLKPSS
jgi:hypothetical protein